MFLKILGNIDGIEDDRSIKIGEKEYKCDVKNGMKNRSERELFRHGLHPWDGDKSGDSRREHYDRRSKNRGDNARSIDLQRQVRALSSKHLLADNPFCILHRDLALPAFYENDSSDNDYHHYDEKNHEKDREFAGANKLESLDNCIRKPGNDPRKD